MEIFMSTTMQNTLILILIFAVVTTTYTFRMEKTRALKIDFSLNEVRCYKGLFAVFIVLDHLWMQHNMISLALFHESAVILVAIFFFFSGYGISIRTARDDTYIESGFWKRRIAGVLAPMITIDLLILLYHCLLGAKVDSKILLLYLNGKVLLNGPTWYMRELLILYLLFYLLVKKKSTPKRMMIGCAAFITLMNIILFLWGYDYSWYGSNYGFLIGMYFGHIVERNTKIQKENNMLPIVLIGSFFLTGMLCIIYKMIGKENILNILLVRNAMTSAATVFFISVASILEVKPKKLDFISAVSMEIYLLHMLVIEICIKAGMEKYPFFLVLEVLVITIGISNLYHKIWSLLRK